MRDIIIIAIVGLGAVLAIRRPWVGVLLWTWVSIMNPHRFAWGIAYDAPVAAIAAGATLIGLLLTRDRRSPFQNSSAGWLAAFALWMTLSWQLGFDPGGDYALWNQVMKIYLMTFVALALLSTKVHLLAFAWATAGSIALIAVKGGFFTLVHGGVYRVWGPPGSFISGNNELALATVAVIPLLHFLQLQLQNRWARHALTVAMLLSAASALGSQSRGGLVALAAMAAVFVIRSRHKFRVGLIVLVGTLALLPMMPAHWWERMETMRTYTEDGSAMGRINAWHVAWETAKHHFFGGGMSYQHDALFIQYGPYEDIVRAAHSIYFQILGNHGFVGLFLFLMIGVSTYRTAGWLRRNARLIPEAKWAADLGSMTQVSMVGFAVGGAFLSLSYFDLPYNIMVLVVLAKRWVELRSWETEPRQSFLVEIGWKKPKKPQMPTLASAPARK